MKFLNIINKTLLRLVLLPSGIYRRMNVNLSQLRSILYVKLLMDDRKRGVLQQTSTRKEKPVTLATLGTMLLSALLGLVYLLAFMIGDDIVTHLTFYFSLFFFMLSATLISDFTSVLIDIRDNYIILPKPVNDRTVILARLLHIFIHICRIVLPMSIPGLIKIYMDYGIGGSLLLFFVVMLLTLFSIFFINAIYIFILRITTPQKFQNIISYIQIVFAILIYASYQVLPRMINDLNLRNFDISQKNGIEFYPMYWFANTWNFFYSFAGNTTIIITAILGCIVPVFSLFIVIRYLAPSFNNKLAMINSAVAAPSSQPVNKITHEKRKSYSELLAGLFTQGQVERMGFLFTWKMTARSRDFKMKVYPSIGYLLVYVVVIVINNKNVSFEQISEQHRTGKLIILSALYFSSILLTMAINQIIYSEKYKASWFYYITPIEKPGEVIMGGAKAAILKFYIPIVFLIMISGWIVIGPSVILNIILGLINQLLIATILVYLGNKMFPFSVHQNTSAKTGSFIRSISILFISACIAIGHYLIYDVMIVLIICILLSFAATWMMMSSIKQTSWKAIKSSYED
ncbi:MAG: hypothetical protein ACXWCZ_01725 [Flavisolibacter sp.]